MKKIRLFANRSRVTRTRIVYFALTVGTVAAAFLLVLLNRWIFSLSERGLYDDPKYEAVSIISADSIGAPLSSSTFCRRNNSASEIFRVPSRNCSIKKSEPESAPRKVIMLWMTKTSDAERVIAQRIFIIVLREFHHSTILFFVLIFANITNNY